MIQGSGGNLRYRGELSDQRLPNEMHGTRVWPWRRLVPHPALRVCLTTPQGYGNERRTAASYQLYP